MAHPASGSSKTIPRSNCLVSDVRRKSLCLIHNVALAFSLPLPKEPPKAFTMLPEYFIEDIVEFYFFLVRFVELNGSGYALA